MDELFDIAEAEDVRLVKEFIQTLLKGKKNLRMYPSNNPIYSRTVEAIYVKLGEALEMLSPLQLRFSRNEITVGSDNVFQGEGKDDNLALFFSRDGVRDLTFNRGIELEEFQEFLEIMVFDFDREDVVDDVVTLMWEKDFVNIKYTVDDSILVDDDDYESQAVSQAKEDTADDDDLSKAYADALNEKDTAETVLMPITGRDMKTMAEIIKKGTGDKRARFINIIFEILPQAKGVEEFGELVAILNNALEFAVMHKYFDTAVNILRRVKSLTLKKEVPDSYKEHMAQVFRFAGSQDIVKVIGDILDSEAGIDEEIFSEYTSYLTRDSVPHFITILGELKNIGARKNVINALTSLGKKDISILAKSLGDSRWYVVRNIIYIMRRIGDKTAVDYLLRAAGHSDVRVRKEVLKTIGELGGEKAAITLKDYLDDPETLIRTTAARALGAVGSEFAKVALLDRFTNREFVDTDFNEKKECFEVLATWKDEVVYDFFMKNLRKWSLMKRAKYNELRAAAAYGMGLLGNPDSKPALEKLRRSKNRQLSEHAYAAIKRLEYGQQRKD